MNILKVNFLTIDECSAEQRIDNYLIKLLKGVPKSHIYRIIRKGEIRVNKKRVKQDYRLQIDDLVRLPPIKLSETAEAPPPSIGSRITQLLENSIIYEDDVLLVLNKPEGMAVHGGSGLSFGVIEALRISRPEQHYLELVHRLDRDTSGCLLIAKKRSALRRLHEGLREHKLKKTYYALLKGHWEGPVKRVIKVSLHKYTLANGERMVRVDPDGKEAWSDFYLEKQYSNCCLVKVDLHTGRTHQIRVHAAHIGMPIVGDDKYGDSAFDRAMKAKGHQRLYLHAAEMYIPAGILGDEALHLKAPIQPAWQVE